MSTNILKAINSIISLNLENTPILDHFNSNISINTMGEGLEYFVKCAFTNSFEASESENNIMFNHNFSWLGSQNHPPDIIIKNSDAIEVKKIERTTSQRSSFGGMALNSSYPKNKLYIDDPRITIDCKLCEPNWDEKDMIYVIGCVEKNTKKLQNIWFVYGDIYAANREVYSSIAERIKNTLTGSNLELSETKELARANRVDPLGVTDLRVRGMWGIKHPANIFTYLNIRNDSKLVAVLKKDKYLSFPNDDRAQLESNRNVTISDNITVKNPNNPANLIDAVIIMT